MKLFLPLSLCLLALAACGSPIPSLSLGTQSPIAIYGQVGRSSMEYVALSNSGSADLRYSISADADWVSLSSKEGVLPPGASTAIRAISACPETAGVISSLITISSNDPEGDRQLELRVLCAGAPELTVPEALELSALVAQDARGTLRVENTGSAPLSFAVGSDETWLGIAEPGGGTVAPGASASVEVFAACGSVGGLREGALIVDSDDPNRSSVRVALKLFCESHSNDTFDLDLVFAEVNMTEARRAAFLRAALRWSEIIAGDLPDWPLAKRAGDCGNDHALETVVDDLMIYVSIRALDGPGGALAAAGPCFLRGAGPKLPVYGTLTIDLDDVAALEADGSFEMVILHQMGHALGFGNAWTRPDLYGENWLEFETLPKGRPCEHASAFAQAPRYVGERGVAAYRELGGEGFPPVEAEHGPGTQCSHWAELSFGNELMTSVVGPSDDSPLSLLTIAALADLGYAVRPDKADPYSLPGCAPECTGAQRVDGGSLAHSAPGMNAAHMNDIVLEPQFVMNRDGTSHALRAWERR